PALRDLDDVAALQPLLVGLLEAVHVPAPAAHGIEGVAVLDVGALAGRRGGQRDDAAAVLADQGRRVHHPEVVPGLLGQRRAAHGGVVEAVLGGAGGPALLRGAV